MTNDDRESSKATARDDLLNIEEAAAQYGIAEGTLRYWLHLRRLPSYKLGRRRKLRRSDIETFIEHHREEAAEADLAALPKVGE